MALDTNLINAFAEQVTSAEDILDSGEYYNGTVKILDGKNYVQIDGSTTITPVAVSSVGLKDGNRVSCTIKDHRLSVIANMSDPSVNKTEVDEVKTKIIEVNTLIAEKVSTKDFEAKIADINDLKADKATVEQLKADMLTVDRADMRYASIDNLNAANAEITNIKAGMLTVDAADAKYATIDNLKVTNETVTNLKGTYSTFEKTVTTDLEAKQASIDKLQTEKLDATSADLRYANIDFANITEAAVKKIFADSGIIKDLIVSEGKITGELVGVTIKGDLIEGGTVIADKLVVKGSNGLYYKLNTDGVTTEAEQTEYNSLNGSVITAKSITATKISVDDLVAFGATIGGYTIKENALYSGVKDSATNTTRGVYMNSDGEFSVGDTKNFLKFWKDIDGTYKLAISASSIVLSSSGKDVESIANDAAEAAAKINDLSIGGRNHVLGTGVAATLTRQDATHTELYKLARPLSKIVNERVPIIESYEILRQDSIDDTSAVASGNVSIMYELIAEDGSVAGYDYFGSTGDYSTDSLEPGVWTTITRVNSSHLRDGSDSFRLVYDVGSYTGTLSIRNLKLEVGTVKTDWTPAPEDLATTNDVEEAKAYSAAQLKILSDNISTLVTDAAGKSMMTQTSSGWTFDMSKIQNGINKNADEINSIAGNLHNAEKTIDDINANVKNLLDTSAYISIGQDDGGNPRLELGKKDSPFRVAISNTSIDFLEGTDKIAYISNKQLYIYSSVVTDELKIGDSTGYIWKRRANNHLGLRYVTS